MHIIQPIFETLKTLYQNDNFQLISSLFVAAYSTLALAVTLINGHKLKKRGLIQEG